MRLMLHPRLRSKLAKLLSRRDTIHPLSGPLSTYPSLPSSMVSHCHISGPRSIHCKLQPDAVIPFLWFAFLHTGASERPAYYATSLSLSFHPSVIFSHPSRSAFQSTPEQGRLCYSFSCQPVYTYLLIPVHSLLLHLTPYALHVC